MKGRIVELEKQLKERDEKIALLEQKIDEIMRRLFGATSEKLTPAQDEGEEPGKPGASSGSDVAPEEDAPKDKPRRRRKKGGKKPYPRNLPVVIDAVLIPDEVKADPDNWEEIGEDHQDLWDMTPAIYFIRRTINKRYKHKGDKSRPPVQAAMPCPPVAGTRCTPGFAAHLLTSKYCDHLPQYRTEQILKTRYGIDMPRQKLNRWNTAIAGRLRPIWEAVQREVLASRYLQIDETPIRYLEPGHGKTKQGYLWIYNDPHGAVYYDWATGRGHENLLRVLGPKEGKHFTGIIQSDGYGAYLTMATHYGEGIRLAACLAHIRRKFYEARHTDRQLAAVIIRLIAHLYRIEKHLREQKASPALREATRSAESAPLYKRLHKIILMLQPRYRPSHPLGKAINYALNQWDKQLLHLTDGHLEIDNNLAENAVRPTKLGMKNWMFFGNAEAGWISACIYTLVENCKRQGLNPEAYIKEVLIHLPENPTPAEAADLTPCKIVTASRHSRRSA
jgi:transposase